MKLSVFFLLGASCTLASLAQAQPLKRFSDIPAESKGLNLGPHIEVGPLIKTEPFELIPAHDKMGNFYLKARFTDAKELLQALVKAAGGTASFKDSVQFPNVGVYTPVTFTIPISGTAEQLIEKVAHAAHVTTSHTGNEWTFSANIVTHFVQGPTFTLKMREAPEAPAWPDFNINPRPGKNLPDDAQPFDFNGKLWYHVPLV